jgi:hypothetical protein
MQSFKEHLHEGSRQKRFRADYMYLHKNGAWHRTTLITSNINLPNLSTSETAVVAYLRRKHNGADINLISLDWMDN